MGGLTRPAAFNQRLIEVTLGTLASRVVLFHLAANGTCADQPNTRTLQAVADAPHEGDHLRWILVRRTMRSFTQTIERSKSLLGKALLPFVNPGARAGNEFKDLTDANTFGKELDSRTPEYNFVIVFLVHNGLVEAVMNEIKISI